MPELPDYGIGDTVALINEYPVQEVQRRFVIQNMTRGDRHYFVDALEVSPGPYEGRVWTQNSADTFKLFMSRSGVRVRPKRYQDREYAYA